jgi:hypothetical protein
MLNTIIQIILSIFLISIMAFIGYSVYNREFIDSISISNTNKKITKIFTGILDYVDTKDVEIETYNKNDYSYLDINPSINQNGGSEYSYNFWLFFRPDATNVIQPTLHDATTHISKLSDNYRSLSPQLTGGKKQFQHIILFYKGESMPIITRNNKTYDCDLDAVIYDYPILVKNPLIKIRNDCKEIIVEYNNINNPETYNNSPSELSSINCTIDNDYPKRNHFKFGIKDIDVDKYKEKFNMVTIVFQEQPKINDLFNNNKSSCKVYFNGDLKSDKLSNTNTLENDAINNFKSRVMRSNLSKLHINPTTTNGTIGLQTLPDGITKMSPLQMADLTYYNYAITSSEIKRLYNNGFNKFNTSIKKRISQSYDKGYNNDSYNIKAI